MIRIKTSNENFPVEGLARECDLPTLRLEFSQTQSKGSLKHSEQLRKRACEKCRAIEDHDTGRSLKLKIKVKL